LGILQGQVTDPSGAAILGASVEVRGQDGAARNVLTDHEGRYRVLALQVGGYTVRIASPGFRPVQSPQVEVLRGTVNAQLEIQACL
jgi:protocatechuate 3,4-dioxygenase beta subunit